MEFSVDFTSYWTYFTMSVLLSILIGFLSYKGTHRDRRSMEDFICPMIGTCIVFCLLSLVIVGIANDSLGIKKGREKRMRRQEMNAQTFIDTLGDVKILMVDFNTRYEGRYTVVGNGITQGEVRAAKGVVPNVGETWKLSIHHRREAILTERIK